MPPSRASTPARQPWRICRHRCPLLRVHRTGSTHGAEAPRKSKSGSCRHAPAKYCRDSKRTERAHFHGAVSRAQSIQQVVRRPAAQQRLLGGFGTVHLQARSGLHSMVTKSEGKASARVPTEL
jgi:hypothetical protein